MRLPTATPGTLATWKSRPVRFGLHAATSHAGSSVPYRDPWSYLRFWISQHYPSSTQADSLALVNQAQHFYAVALSAPSESSPLLWYYCFLNISKALLLKTPATFPLTQVEHARHGIADPWINNSTYVSLTNQKVTAYPKHSTETPPKLQVFPSLCEALETPIAFPPGQQRAEFSLKSLLSQIVSIHRAYTTAFGERMNFCRTEVTSLEVRSGTGRSGQLWHTLTLDKLDVKASSTGLRAFQSAPMTAVSPAQKETHLLEMSPARFTNSTFLSVLAQQRKSMRKVVHPLILPQGYRYYLFADQAALRQPAAIFGVMFYLGSIVRYKPQRYEALIGEKYRWLIEEFLQICPKQFVVLLANEITDSELPYFET